MTRDTKQITNITEILILVRCLDDGPAVRSIPVGVVHVLVRQHRRIRREEPPIVHATAADPEDVQWWAWLLWCTLGAIHVASPTMNRWTGVISATLIRANY